MIQAKSDPLSQIPFKPEKIIQVFPISLMAEFIELRFVRANQLAHIEAWETGKEVKKLDPRFLTIKKIIIIVKLKPVKTYENSQDRRSRQYFREGS